MESNIVQDVIYQNLTEKARELQKEGWFSVHYLNTETGQNATIPITSDVAYLCFHSDIWEILKPAEKMIAVVWMEKLISISQNRKAIKIHFHHDNNKSILNLKFDRKTNQFIYEVHALNLNLTYLSPHTILVDLMGFGMIQNFFQVKEKLQQTGELDERYSYLELANALRPMSRPSVYEKYLDNLGSGLVLDELKEIALYHNQPLKQKQKEQINLINEYMLVAEEALALEDTGWQDYMDKLTEVDELIMSIYNEFFDKDYYQEYYAKDIAKLKTNEYQKE